MRKLFACVTIFSVMIFVFFIGCKKEERYINISCYNPPEIIEESTDYELAGKMESNEIIRYAGVRIKDNEKNVYEVSKTLKNDKNTFYLEDLDEAISFKSLPKGEKTIEVIAIVDKEVEVIKSDIFNVGKKESLMKWPVPGSSIISSCYLDNREHYAIDIKGEDGMDIISCCDGKVVALNNDCTHNYAKSESCGCGEGFGNYIVVENTTGGDVRYVRYSHLSSVHVALGEDISEGDNIGRMGSTGYSQGFHLDLKMYTEGGYADNTYCVDPTFYMKIPKDISVLPDSWQCCYDYVDELKKRLGYE